MTLMKIQVNRSADSPFPRHRLVNTLHFESDVDPVAQEALLNAVLDAYIATWSTLQSREWIARSYEVGPPPQYPVAEVVRNEGFAPVSGVPREIALCLSFFSERNVPRQRGRLYLPLLENSNALAVRPSPTQMADAMALGQALFDISAAGATWGIYSQSDDVWRPVTHIWVDNEWDTMRSRGLDADARSEASVT
jgi:hypothetical protein